MLFHGKWQLALTLICWCCVTIHAFYGGVDSGCSQAVNDLQLHSNVMSSWCLYQNPFASRQRFISDVSLFDDDKSNFKYVCHPSESGSKCTSVVSIRSYSDSMKEDFVPGGVLVLALITGEVFLYNTHLKMGLPLTDQYSDTAVERRERFEMLNLTTMASVVRSNDSYYLETVVVQEMEPTLRRYYFDRDVRVVDMVLFATRSGIPVSANLVVSEVDKSAQVIFISFGQDFERVATWSVTIPVEHIGSLHMSHFSQKVDLPKHSPMNVRNVTAVTRNLIVLHTKELLAIFEFNMNSQEDIQIDLQTATEVNSKYLFYRAHNMFEITAAVAMAENVRRPMDIGSRTSCSNVEYPLAQAVYLQIAEYNYDERKSRIITHYVPEFATYQFEEEEDCTLNPVQRPSKFDCSPGDYLDVSQNCKTPLQSSLEMDRKVLKLLTSFTDLNSTLGVSQTESYLANGELNPKAICESFTLYPYANNSNFNYTHCMQEIPNHKISCEYDLLASGLNEYLDSFYYLFWKNHIYAVSDDNIISVLTQTIKYDTPAGFKMTLANKLQTEGTIIDLHVSSNDQHLFASVERDEWVFESNQRFVEVCNRLKEDPDNIFLKSFTRACDSYSPRDVSINDFALVSSSCADGVLCSSFNTPIINPHPRPGVFVYRSFIELECPKGSYCPGNGLKQSCPPGLLCDKIGMATPSICPYPLKGGSNKNGHPLEHTCFAEGLSQPMKTPPGTWSATAIFPPVFIPPGQFLLKIRNKHHEIKTIGVRDCKIGDYCGLGREVIIEEGETNLDELLCPPNTYCLDSSVIEPTICSSPNRSMDYCPIGSFSISKCPAGHYCPSPDKKFPCSPSQYCPSGSYLANICDAGYYCPNATVRIQCPEGYFCKAGARSPDRCTFFFSKCPPGSVQDSLTASGVVVIISLFGAILGCYIVYRVAAHVARKYHGRKREERKSKKMVAKAVSEQTPLSTSSSPITIGGSSIELHKPDYWVDIRFENLGLKLSNGQTVMSGVTGSIEHGKLTAVMGVSGAGKSTFISTLAGRAYYGTTVGKIFVNGKAVHSLNRFKNRIGFVPQDDIMIRECTVEETLYFSARTRLDKSKTLQEINDIVDNVIHVLQLEHVRHSIIGDEETRGISGGERKRVSVGIELVAQPIILFCDEPTSGLDSASSKEVCAALKSIAQSGITVVSVIHQPRYEIFEMFDTLLLLGKGGRTVYIGEVQKAQDYFEEIGYNFPPKVNPADYLMDITSGNVEAEVSSQVGSQFSLPVNAANLPGIWDSMTSMRVAVSELDSNEQESNQKYTRSSTSVLAQFWMCLQRSVIQQFRAITTVFLDCFLVLIAGLVVGLIYLNSRYKGPLAKEITDMCPSVLQPRCKMPLADPIAPEANLITVGMSLCGVMAALRVYGREKTVFKKEAQSGLSTFLYFWARDFSMIPNVLLGTLVFLAIYYALIAPLASVPIYFSAIVLTYWSAYGLGYVISIIISPQTAQLAAVVVIFVMNIFSGANPRLGEIYDMSFPMNIAPYFSFLSYSMELLYLNELWHYRKVYDVKLSLQGMGYHFSDFTYCWVGLLLQGLVLRCIAFSLLSLSKPNHFVYRLWSRVSSRIQLRRRLNIIKFWKRRNSEAYSSIQATA